ncbi:hypothetical protein H5392_09875 [Tessaracoccus sp. MC1865]|uniref:SH3 domain-containing protein n=1 Tax=Tessaracoccus sp. MC1865 TaxID=2760310 RepID=UPI0016003A1C|nr:SH3 domain-containing protein [Tessaracoccus sp. MC1865]MBB1484165.1 hypothetical protein [Tessaracoccus sp. MC1865]QTO37189.1 hypothetical protein J7D54_12240 [Tessaracoccus sp. MC1865]
MGTPRRAAADDAAVQDDAGELQTVTDARRAAGLTRGRGRAVRFAMAPLAMLTVGGLAAGVFWLGQPADSTETVQSARPVANLGVSRSQARPELSPSASPSPSREPLDTAAAAAANPALPTPTAVVTPSTPAPAPAPAKAISDEAASGEVAGVAESAPAAAESAEPVAEVVEEPAVDYTALGEASSTLFVTAAVNVRTGPGTEFDVRSSLAEAAEVATTAWEVDGWRQVSLDGEAGWIKGTFLTDSKPTVEAVQEAASGSGSSSAAAAPAAVCEQASGLERNLTNRTANVLRVVCAEFPRVTSYGGYRPGDTDSYHGSGQAIDVMVSGEYGWDIARWARANAGELGIIEVIYEQQIWTAQRAGDGWRPMSDRGSVSANHYDHVHLSVR